MKKALLVLTALILTNCTSTPYKPSSDLGTNCKPYPEAQKEGEPKKKLCIDVNYGYDPVRFHYVPAWDRERLPSMPDLD